MTLYLIGLGLADASDITLKGIAAVKSAGIVYLETYTSVLQCSIEELGKALGKKILPANRQLVEQEADQKLLKQALTSEVVLLIPGDPLSATTHHDLLTRAKELKVPVRIIHNASIFTAVASTGLHIYKFGKTASIPFAEKDYEPESFYDVLQQNQSIEAHTLFLLDLKPDENKFMTVNDAIRTLQRVELRRGKKLVANNLVVGCARLGAKDEIIKVGTVKDILKEDFGKPPHCLIIPSKLHFTEEEALKRFAVGSYSA
ncbi:diphthine synthase [Candidatus Woesearchaeota archaeon]|nr:diphthine synthase [Candidatus Woesearchaeota archaeon]